MRKLFNYKFVFAAAIVGSLVSCNDDDNETASARTFKPTVTVEETNFTVLEGDMVQLVLNTATPLNQRMEFKLELAGGTANFRDYTVDGDADSTTDEETNIDDGWGVIGHKVIFPAYATSHTVDITTIYDLLPEDVETIQLKLIPMGNSNGLVDAASELITITVNPKTSNDFVVVADWKETKANAHGNLESAVYTDTTGGDEHDYCMFDFDLEIYDVDFNVYADDYSGCPATITLPESAPDGVYFIVPSFWSAATGPNDVPKLAEDEDIRFKMKVTMAKPGIWIHEVNYDEIWTYKTGGLNEGLPANIGYQIAGVLIKTGTTYELQDIDGNILAQGRMADFKLKSRKNRK